MNSIRIRSAVRVGAILLGVSLVSSVVVGHVEYVGDGERGDPIAFLMEALLNPVVVAALTGPF